MQSPESLAEALEARLSHTVDTMGRAYTDGDMALAGSRMDLHPRAWGAHMDILRFFRTGVPGGDGVPGLLLGALIRCTSTRLAHRGPWLYPTWVPAPMPATDSQQNVDEMLTEAAHKPELQLFPMATEPTSRNRRNPPGLTEE